MKSKVAVFCGLLVVVLVLAWNMLVFGPKGRTLDEARETAEQAEVKTAELERTVAALEQLEKERPATRAALEKLRSSLPADPDLDRFIVQLDGIAEQTGIDWISVVPTPPTANAVGTGEVRVNIQLSGGYFQVLDYLRRLEDLDRLVVVDGLELSSESGGSATGTGEEGGPATDGPSLSATVQARMFVLNPPGVAGAPSTAGNTGTDSAAAPAAGPAQTEVER